MLDTLFLNAALAYAAAGIAVFPCLPNDKRPACEHGHLDATTDATLIAACQCVAWPHMTYGSAGGTAWLEERAKRELVGPVISPH